MEITEEKLFEVFGVTPGEKDPEPAEPEEDSQEESSENTDEEPSVSGSSSERTSSGATELSAHVTEANGDEACEDDEGEKESEAAEQTPEQRRENARRRRQQETQAAISAAVQKALQERDARYAEEQENFFKQAGLINPFTKEPITNMDEFREWREEQDNQKIQKELQSGKLTRETLEELIDRHPAIQEARQAQEARQQQEEKQQEQAFLQDVDRQLKKIQESDPTIKTVADLMNRPYSKAFYEAVKRGCNFEDAYYLATRGQQREATEEAARQSAVNNLRSKEHLKATSIGGRAGATVSTEEREMYRLFNPNATDDQIQRFQNRFKKS